MTEWNKMKGKTIYTLTVRNPKGKLIYKLVTGKHTKAQILKICDAFWGDIED